MLKRTLALLLVVGGLTQIKSQDQALIYTSFFGGNSTDIANDVNLSETSFDLGINTQTDLLFCTPDAYQSDHSNTLSSDCYLAFFNLELDQLVFATYFGGFENDVLKAIDVKNENFLFTGFTKSIDFPITDEAHQTEKASVDDEEGFITLFSNNELVWSTYFGSEGRDFIEDAVFLDDGSIVVVGYTDSQNMATEGAFQEDLNSPDGQASGLIARFDPSGNLVWSTYFGGSEFDSVNWVEVLVNDRIVVAGNTESTDLPVSDDAHQSEFGGGLNDTFLAIFTHDGELLSSTYYGGEELESISDLKVSSQDEIIITGSSWSETGISTSGSYQENFQGPADYFLAKFNDLDNVDWATYLGGESFDDIPNMQLALENDHIYLSANGTSQTGIAHGMDPLYSMPEGFTNYIQCFSLEGQITWGTYFIPEMGGNIITTAIEVNQLGDIYLTGIVSPSQAPLLIPYAVNGIQSQPGGDVDVTLFRVRENVLSTNDAVDENSFKVFPNPTANSFSITSDEYSFDSITIYNSSGQQIYLGTFPSLVRGVRNIVIDHPGFYVVELSRQNRSLVRERIIVN